MSQTFQPRRDIAANWTAANPVLPARVLAVETDTGLFKLGDGVTAWNALPHYGGASHSPGIVVESTEVLAAPAATVTITPTAGAKGWRIEAKLRGAAALPTRDLHVRLNGDSTAVYQSQMFYATSTTVAAREDATPTTSMILGHIPADTATANYFGHLILEVPFPGMTTGWKDVLARAGFAYDTSAAGIYYDQSWGIYRSTSALTSISILPASGGIAAGSTFKITTLH